MKTHNLPDDYLAALGHRVKLIRTYLKFDQREMSERMHTAQSQISKIESGRSAPSVYQLLMVKNIADEDPYLREHLTWEWILEGKGRGVIG
jgi:transcriptional regulator with XRE-family HTH domain